MDTEWYECYYYTYKHFCVETKDVETSPKTAEWLACEENELVRKECYQMRGTDLYTHFVINYAHRHPNHWE